MPKILPVIMCGGSDTRLWPESRQSMPKQFIPVVGERSTFQVAAALVADPTIFETTVVVTNGEFCFRVAEQLREIGREATILLEPEPCDSAAAVAAAAKWAGVRDAKTLVIVLAADHIFSHGHRFGELCTRASFAWSRCSRPSVTQKPLSTEAATGHGATIRVSAKASVIRSSASSCGRADDYHCSGTIIARNTGWLSAARQK
jgi:mannose-1-phosphate guanylyltransferase/mannose-6-phosphate isomerase